MVADLWELDMAPFHHELHNGGLYGRFPFDCTCEIRIHDFSKLRGQGQFSGKKIYPVGRKLLGSEITEMFVMLRMNAKFYKYFERARTQKVAFATS